MKILIALFATVLLLSVTAAEARRGGYSYGGGRHSASHGGYYAGGIGGSSHKGGKYRGPHGGYGRHR
jgi:hypothetical protein